MHAHGLRKVPASTHHACNDVGVSTILGRQDSNFVIEMLQMHMMQLNQRPWY